MKLTQVKGNTWVLEGDQLIPLYKLDDRRCILLDSGLKEEREEIEAALTQAGLTPVGILCSHVHTDHAGNNRWFQERRGVSVALTAPEAGMCSNLLAMKCYFVLLFTQTVEEQAGHIIHTPDVIIPAQDGPFSFCGAEFQIVHTPGHAAGHICTVTPDGVLYAADALLGRDWANVKLPYNLSHSMAEASREKLRELEWDTYILAHREVCDRGEFLELLDQNQRLLHRRAEDICFLLTHAMTAGELTKIVCAAYSLYSKRIRRALWVERNVRFFLEYLMEQGRVKTDIRSGVVYYLRTED